MSDARWEEVKRIHGEAQDLPESQRAAYVARECRGDAELQAFVERLLEQDLGDDFLSVFDPAAQEEEKPPVPELGGYRLLNRIGRGGMGASVWLALDPALNRFLAVKTIQASSVSERNLERFHRESRHVARLDHDGIVKVYTEGKNDGLHYFAMEFVDGHDLAKEIRLQTAPLPKPSATLLPAFGDPQYFKEVARIGFEVAEALDEAHRNGIVHRDIKPANILVRRRDKRAKVVDFGLARDESMGELTLTGEIGGTPHYMSPEQARVSSAKVDHRTDIYSLGVVLYELLSGRRPYRGESYHEITRSLKRDVPAPVRRLNPRVPWDLAAICHAAMAKEVRHRYPTALRLAEDLKRFLEHQAVSPPMVSWRARAAGFASRHKLALGAAALLIASALGAILFADRRVRQKDVQDRLDEIALVSAAADWDVADLTQLGKARAAVARLSSDSGALSHEQNVLVRAVGLRLESYRKERLARGRTSLEKATAAEDPADRSREQWMLEGAVDLMRLATVFPDDREVLAAVPDRPAEPRISIEVIDATNHPVAGTASYRELDPTTGLPADVVLLGSLPIRETAMPAGYHRFELDFGTRGRRECTRLIERFRRETIALRLGTGPSKPTPMITIERGAMSIRDRDATPSGLNDRTVTIEAFEIEAYEVSNAQYREFLADTKRPAPEYFGRIVPGSEQDRLPIVDVSFTDARDYAEWAGKRLPSYAEWVFAARGPEMRRYPWGDDAPPYRENTRKERPKNAGREADFDLYLRCAVPVDEGMDYQHPRGLFHTLGNVAEWTESLGVDIPVGRSWKPFSNERFVAGSDWSAEVRNHSLVTSRKRGTGPLDISLTHGFRCARSRP